MGRKIPTFKPGFIVIHCSATKEGAELSPSELDEMHRKRGFDGCGYHFYIRRNGRVYPMRSLDTMGAHVKGYNHLSIGICYEGGLDARGNPADTRTHRQKQSIMAVIKSLQKVFRIKQVLGHRDLSPDLDGDGVVEPHEWVKVCPCFDAMQEYMNVTL